MSSLFMCTDPFMKGDHSESTQFLKAQYLKCAILRVKFYSYHRIFWVQHKSPAFVRVFIPKFPAYSTMPTVACFFKLQAEASVVLSARSIIFPNGNLLTKFVKHFSSITFILRLILIPLKMFLLIQNSGHLSPLISLNSFPSSYLLITF